MQRNHIVMVDYDREIYFHGIVIAPEGMSVADAKTAIDMAYEAAKAEKPDEWNFNEVMEKIEALPGFDTIMPNDEFHDIWIEPS